MDEPSIKVPGQGKDSCRAVDTQGETIGFLLTMIREAKFSLTLLEKSNWSKRQSKV